MGCFPPPGGVGPIMIPNRGLPVCGDCRKIEPQRHGDAEAQRHRKEWDTDGHGWTRIITDSEIGRRSRRRSSTAATGESAHRSECEHSFRNQKEEPTSTKSRQYEVKSRSGTRIHPEDKSVFIRVHPCPILRWISAFFIWMTCLLDIVRPGSPGLPL